MTEPRFTPEQRAEIIRMALAEAGHPAADMFLGPHRRCGHPIPFTWRGVVPTETVYRASRLAYPDDPDPLSIEEFEALSMSASPPRPCLDCRLRADA